MRLATALGVHTRLLRLGGWRRAERFVASWAPSLGLSSAPLARDSPATAHNNSPLSYVFRSRRPAKLNSIGHQRLGYRTPRSLLQCSQTQSATCPSVVVSI